MSPIKPLLLSNGPQFAHGESSTATGNRQRKRYASCTGSCLLGSRAMGVERSGDGEFSAVGVWFGTDRRG